MPTLDTSFETLYPEILAKINHRLSTLHVEGLCTQHFGEGSQGVDGGETLRCQVCGYSLLELCSDRASLLGSNGVAL